MIINLTICWLVLRSAYFTFSSIITNFIHFFLFKWIWSSVVDLSSLSISLNLHCFAFVSALNRYASAPQELRTDWNKFTKDYFLNRSTLVSVFLLIDASIPAKKIDLEYASWLGQNQVKSSFLVDEIKGIYQLMTCRC